MTDDNRTEIDGTPQPVVSVIIPHLNTPELLVRALQSVAMQKLDRGHAEIIVVDNGSRMSLEPIRRAWPQVRFLVEHEPGPGPARNLGVKHARADLLAFIDADVQVLPGWMQAGLDALGENPDSPIGGDVRLIVADPAHLTGVEAFECVFSFRQREYIEKKHYSVTANLMVSRRTFERAGPFGGIDTAEDMMFGQRAWRMGMPTRYVPAMRAMHPTRRDFADMRRKWHRLSIQAHSRYRGSAVRWYARSVAVGISPIAHVPQVFSSDRIGGFGNRWRALAFLFRIRTARALDMIRLAREAKGGSGARALNWNR